MTLMYEIHLYILKMYLRTKTSTF